MTPTRRNSFRLFQFAGINVYLHWSWFVVAAFEINSRTRLYSSSVWNVLEYLGLFLIVLMHEFGHSLACRQVGGQANQIVLWPLGGVAYVDPPQRPGATLWSIAAGPLVNVVLLPFLTIALMNAKPPGWGQSMPDLASFVRALWMINTLLLCFNLLPIYPLDGGQILRALLWFKLGRGRSLMVAAIIGFIGVAVLIVVALLAKWVWLGILSAFILMNCWGGLLQARALSRADNAARHESFQCPSCHAAPPKGNFWGCSKCRTIFDTFETNAVCPKCGTQFDVTRCPSCGGSHPMGQWSVPPLVNPVG